jgi:protein arginine N-methyltransferase 1
VQEISELLNNAEDGEKGRLFDTKLDPFIDGFIDMGFDGDESPFNEMRKEAGHDRDDGRRLTTASQSKVSRVDVNSISMPYTIQSTMALRGVDRQSCDYYFDSYSHYSVHEEILKDKVRIPTYKKAIVENPSLFLGKTVLDVGTGTGILALLAAQSGARKVYAVERGALAEYATAIVERNHYADQIEVIPRAMEDAEIPEQVDVVLSDWMGYCLFFETMLPSVILARDRFMRPGGTMFPSRAKLFIIGIEDREYRAEKIGFWDDVYGFPFTSVKKWALIEPLVESCPTERIITETSEILDIDLNTVTVEMLNIDCSFSLIPTKTETLDAFALWFDVLFEGPQQTVILSTSPWEEGTRWYQSIFYLETPLAVTAGSPVRGRFRMELNIANPRDQDFVISWEADAGPCSQVYKMR